MYQFYSSHLTYVRGRVLIVNAIAIAIAIAIASLTGIALSFGVLVSFPKKSN